MKKEYLKPEIFVEEIILETMLAASMGVGEEDQKPSGGTAANDRRGGWGDLWD